MNDQVTRCGYWHCHRCLSVGQAFLMTSANVAVILCAACLEELSTSSDPVCPLPERAVDEPTRQADHIVI